MPFTFIHYFVYRKNVVIISSLFLNLCLLARLLCGDRLGDGYRSSEHVLLPSIVVQPLQDASIRRWDQEIHQFHQLHRRWRLSFVQTRLQLVHQTLQSVHQRMGTSSSAAIAVQMEAGFRFHRVRRIGWILLSTTCRQDIENADRTSFLLQFRFEWIGWGLQTSHCTTQQQEGNH